MPRRRATLRAFLARLLLTGARHGHGRAARYSIDLHHPRAHHRRSIRAGRRAAQIIDPRGLVDLNEPQRTRRPEQ